MSSTKLTNCQYWFHRHKYSCENFSSTVGCYPGIPDTLRGFCYLYRYMSCKSIEPNYSVLRSVFSSYERLLRLSKVHKYGQGPEHPFLTPFRVQAYCKDLRSRKTRFRNNQDQTFVRMRGQLCVEFYPMFQYSE